jgi:CheY-like chemotaxis protein
LFRCSHLPPRNELPCDIEAPVVVPATACAQLRILLVEDNPANQKLATYVLEDRGHLVEVAGDGQEAVGLTEKNSYDVILMDVQMPGMNGLEATAAIRRREHDGRRIPIIAMTAHAMRGDRERCLAVGMDGYLLHPDECCPVRRAVAAAKRRTNSIRWSQWLTCRFSRCRRIHLSTALLEPPLLGRVPVHQSESGHCSDQKNRLRLGCGTDGLHVGLGYRRQLCCPL